jgi:transcriptional regulator with XRE-family HTH domain
MSAFEHAFSAAIDDMNAGRLRDPEHYLGMVPAQRRAELSNLLAAVVATRGPSPASDAKTTEGYARAMAAIADVEGSAGPTGILPGALRRLRLARGLEREQVLAALSEDLGIGESGSAALRRHYQELATGRLVGSRIAHRLLRSLAKVFDADPDDFIAAAQPIGTTTPKLRAVPSMGRSAGENPPPVAGSQQRREAVGSDPNVELVERLFTGGPDA